MNSVELVTQEGWIDGLERSDLTRNLGNDRCDRAETVDSVRSKSFQIRLDPGTGRGIGPGDGESEGRAIVRSLEAVRCVGPRRLRNHALEEIGIGALLAD